jgi:hypothetical protein
MIARGHAGGGPRIPVGSYTGIGERLEDVFISEDIFELGAAPQREVLEFGAALIESRIAERKPAPRTLLPSRRQARSFWGAENRVRVTVSGSATASGTAVTFFNNIIAVSTAWTSVNTAIVGTAGTFFNNVMAGNATGMVFSSATLETEVFHYEIPAAQPITFPATAALPPANFGSLRTELIKRQADLASWDEDDGDRPNEKAFDDAKAFIGRIPADVPLPSLYVSGDAEVGFSWMLDDGFIEAAFRGDSKIRYASRFGDDLNGDVCEFRSTKVMPMPLMAALERLGHR